MPEILDFLAFTLLILSPTSFTPLSPLPGTFPFPDVFDERYKSLKLRSSKLPSVSEASPSTPTLTDLPSIKNEGEVPEQVKIDLLAIAFKLVSKFRELWAGSDAYVEIFRPVEEVLKGMKAKKLPGGLQVCLFLAPIQDMYLEKSISHLCLHFSYPKALHKTTLSTLSNTLKFSLQARRPLRLQSHKPIPIPSYIPKFEGSFYTPGKRYDPDSERNAASKLRSQYKQEKKGAIRELRKDAKFLSAERNRVKDEKDKACKFLLFFYLLGGISRKLILNAYEDEQRMRSAHGAIQVERSEEKQMEREKARDKKRAGK